MRKNKGFYLNSISFLYQKVYLFVIIFFVLFVCFNKIDVEAEGENKEFSYTGEYQEYVVPKDGIYKIQLWGAQGGNYDSTLFGGYGGYTSGNVKLKKGEKLYFYVGGQPSSNQWNYTGGWNGGGNTPSGKDKDGRAGGGATDVRTEKTSTPAVWKETKSLASRIMVAGGGGGAAYESSSRWLSNGGNAGGINGFEPNYIGSSSAGHYGTGGTQTAGGYTVAAPTNATAIGVFGAGGNGINTDGGAGGGSGWYGGGGSYTCSGGGGGSSYVSGHNGCIAVTSDGSPINTKKVTQNQSYSWTNYVFFDTKIVDGAGYSWTNIRDTKTDQPTHDGSATQSGNTGDGYAKITYVRELSNDNSLTDITATEGILSPSFSSTTYEYDLVMDKEKTETEISATLSDAFASLTGDGKFSIRYNEEKLVELSVTSESGLVQVYRIHLKRARLNSGEHSSKLAELFLNMEKSNLDLILNPAFSSDTTNYSIEIAPNALSVAVDAVAYDSEATIKIEGNELIINDTGNITITVSEPNSSDTVYTISYTRGEKPKEEYTYNYTGGYQTFIAPTRGKYKIELWGSQGANLGSRLGGKGAYTSGDIVLNKGDTLYIYVGNNTFHSYNHSFNGGAMGTSTGAFGGGSTDIRLEKNDDWDDFYSKASRIMVAAGGGGANLWSYGSDGGAAGGLYAYDYPYFATGSWGYTLNTGGTQTSAGLGFYSSNEGKHGQPGGFGYGGTGHTSSGYGGGGGSGYYGGGGGGDGGPMTSSGMGGSSYISGHPGCDSIDESSSPGARIHTGESVHYSGKYFENTVMIDGLGYRWKTANSDPKYNAAGSNGEHAVLASGQYEGQPTHDGTKKVEGNEGNGFAKITPLFLKSQNNYLKSITSDVGVLSPTFSPTQFEYDLVLEKEQRYVTIDAEVADNTATVTGTGKRKIKYTHPQTVELSVTSESGDIRVYRVNIKRDELKSGEHSSKLADLDFVVDSNAVEPILKPDFHSNTFDYTVEISPDALDLTLDAIPFDSEATVKIEGNRLLIGNEGQITITVTEPNCSDTIYTISYRRGVMPDSEYTYESTGDYQVFTAPTRGKYRFELWGSQGSNLGNFIGGKGAYTKGDILLDTGEKLYIYVGNTITHGNSFNGGAVGTSAGSGGGGATDIRLTPGEWYDFNSLKTRIMVAAGGGGVTTWYSGSNGGAGGGLFSYDVPYYARGSWGLALNTGATQTSGGVGFNSASGRHGGNGVFGIGGIGHTSSGYGGGGGGGYYGGSGGGDGGPMTSSGSGGSSYISGHPGSNSISSDSTQNNIKHLNDNIHYSGKYFENTEMIDGLGYRWVDATSSPKYTPAGSNGANSILSAGEYTGQPTYDGTGIQDGNSNYGRAKITPLFTKSRNNYLLDLKTNYGTFNKDFDTFDNSYILTLDKYEQHFTLEGVLADSNATVKGLGKYKIDLGETKIIDIVVTAPNGEERTYQVTATRGALAPGEHSTKLVSLDLNHGKYDLDPEFISIVTDYTIEIPHNRMSIDDIETETYDPEAKVEIKGNEYLSLDEDNEITITVTHPLVDTTVYKIKIIREPEVGHQTFTYQCTGEYQEFVAPASTYYKIRNWGARGGYGRTNWSLRYRGGYGAYTEGEIYLRKGTKLYVYVGCEGKDSAYTSRFVGGPGGFNGGANGGDDTNQDSAPEPGGGGGGATDIRLTPSKKLTGWDEFDSLKSRIMVAAGGGGGHYSDIGGAGGTIKGTMGYNTKPIPNQISGYAFGYGMPGGSCSDGSGGAGSGYYGGYSGTGCGHSGGGGSSFVSGCEDCVAIDENSTDTNIISSNTNTHYSGYKFDRIQMFSGEEEQPNPTGGYQLGNNGDGYAIIETAKPRSENNYLKELTTDKGTLTPDFDKLKKKYTLKLTPEDDTIHIGAVPEDKVAEVTGIGDLDVPAGKTTFPITVTAENGDIRIYNIEVEREKSANPYPINIKIDGLIPNLCEKNNRYCKQDQEFNPDTPSYTMVVPSKIQKVKLVVEKGHKYQTVKGDGEVTLADDVNTFVVEVTSEDGSKVATYTYTIIKDTSGNANIEKLEVLNPPTEIHFDPDKTEYYFSIPNTYTKLELNVVLEDQKATYQVIGNENFKTGLNVVEIVVTALNKETKTYTLNVYREQSGNTFLSSLEVSNDTEIFDLNPKFNKIISNYTVNVGNEIDEVNIIATPEHSLTTITGAGTKSLKIGTNTFNITSTSEDGSIQVYEVVIIRAKNSDATLKKLEALEGSLSPNFQSNNFEYNLEVSAGVTSLNLDVETTVPTSKYKITGNYGFQINTDNIVNITVTAEDGTTNVYKLHVKRNAATNNYLNYLNTDCYNLTSEFNKELEEYNITVGSNITTIKVSATPEDSSATVSGTGIYNLKTGLNEISIVVTAEDGSTRTYMVKVEKEASNNNYLSSLTTNSTVAYSPTFVKTCFAYTMTVGADVDKLTVLGVSEDQKASVIGNGEYTLKTGSNNIEITVKAENGDTQVYRLTVTKEASNNANLSMIIAKESVLDPAFEKNKTEYELKVIESVTSLTLTITKEDPKSTYEVIGNENFEIGDNAVTIRVTAEDGTTKDYHLTVVRQEAGTTSNRLINLEVNQGTLDPPFDSDTNYYEVELPNNITTITLSGELEDKNATVTGFADYSLNVGQNVLSVAVTSVEGVIRYYQVVVTRKEVDEARLASLQIADTTLNPSFDKDTFEYTLVATEPQLTIQAVPLDSDATVEIIGNKDLKLGSNQVIVRVTAKDKKTTKDYILNVNRSKSINNNLKSLKVDGTTISPVFEKSTTLYTATVGSEVNTLQIEAIPENLLAQVRGDGEVTLTPGVNNIEIEVESEAGTKKIYTIVVTREASSNNYLESLTTSSGTLNPTFAKETNDYVVVVPYEVDDILVDGKAEDTKAKVSGFAKYSLNVGINNIDITVTAEDGSTNTYKLKVRREQLVSSKLQSLSAKSYSFTQIFNKEVFDYNLSVDSEVDSLVLNIVPEDPNATYRVVGNSDFIVGMNIVKIIVTDSLGGDTSTYTLNVNKQNYSNTYLSYIYTSQGTLTPNFIKTTLDYTVNVGNEVDSIEVLAEPEVSTNTVTGPGTYSLVPGDNKIDLKVETPTGVSRVYHVNIIRERKTKNHLLNLQVKIEGELQTLTPDFNKEVLEYSLNVPKETKTIEILGKAEENATVKGLGVKTVKSGANQYQITVTSEDGEINIYQLTVNKEKSDNNNLLNIIPSIGTLSPSFSSNQDEYSLVLDASASVLSFNVVKEDASSKVTGIAVETVPDGLSKREIVVEAEDGSIHKYTINVYKEKTDEARLANLEINGYTLNETFDKDIYSYTLTVPNNKYVLLSSEVVATPLDSKATVSKTSSLTLSSLATNIYTIVVTAKDGFTKKTYTIAIDREKGSDSTLSKLEFSFGNFTETFSSNKTEYTLKVPKNITTIPSSDVEAIPTDSDATVTIPSTFTFDSSHTVYEIVVESADKSSTTTYTIHLEILESSNALLSNLSVDHGVLSPAFDKDHNHYTLDLDSEVDTLEITATKEDEKATISGDGMQTVVTGINRYEIVVTAEDGTVNTYVIEATREKSSNTNITNIIPSHGSLSPSYSSEIDTYEVEVGSDIDTIDFDVQLESKRATVSGDKNNTLNYGENNITITVEAEDGTTKEVHIKVIREKKITDIEVPEEILMDVGDIEVVEVKITPSDATYKELVWQSSDTDIVTVTDGTLEAKKLGEAIITVSSARDNTIEKQIKVRVVNLKISSDIYDVRRDVLFLNDNSQIQHLIIGAEPLEDLDTFLSKLKNEKELIKFYTIDNVEITDTKATTVATGQIIRLEYKNKVYDSVYIVVRGEVTKEGIVDADDYNELVKQVLSKKTYAHDSLEFKASDVIETDNIDADDSQKVAKFVLGKDTNLNKK